MLALILGTLVACTDYGMHAKVDAHDILDTGGRDWPSSGDSTIEEDTRTGMPAQFDDGPTDQGAVPTTSADDCYNPSFGKTDRPGAELRVAQNGAVLDITYYATSTAYYDALYLDSPEEIYVATSNRTVVGETLRVGPFDRGERLRFRIDVENSGYTYYSGPESQNPDGVLHGAAQWIDDCTFVVGFEDMHNGGDQDFNDMEIEVVGPVEQVL